MNILRKIALPVAASLIGVVIGCGVPKSVHCKFVTDVGSAAEHYGAAASAASNVGYQAEAKELKKTVDAEKQKYCAE